LELWGEVGAIIAPASGIGILAQAPYCKFKKLIVDPFAGAVGIHVDTTGIWNDFYDVRIKPGAITGYDVDAAGCRFERCNASSPASGGYGFDIGANSTKLIDCFTAGMSGVATTGFYLRSGIKGSLDNCNSIQHSTAGFVLDAGVTNMMITRCSSGGGDGDRIDNGTNNMWADFSDTLRREYHEHIYPMPDGEGAAGDSIVITTDAEDDTNAVATSNDYWGEPMVIIAPAVITTQWNFKGLNLYATTVDKEIRSCAYRIVYNTRASRNAGNAWDEGATVLTFDDASDYAANDLIWIASSAYIPNGEIVKVVSVVGAVVTIVRETSQFGAPNTGLRWDHTTNVGGGTLYAYLCDRTERQYHESCFDFSAGTKKDFTRMLWSVPRGMNANDGMIIRSQNGTDGTTCIYNVTAIYRD